MPDSDSGTIDIGGTPAPADPVIHPADPAAPTGSAPGGAGAPGGGSPASPGGSPAAAAGAPDPAKDKPPSIWIWQDSDDTPVKVKTKAPRGHRMSFNPLTDTGFWMNVKGNANFGASSESQTGAPSYNNMAEGVQLDANGIIYNPGLVNYSLTASYNRNQLGQGSRDNTLDGLSYGARVSLLTATPVPTTFSIIRNDQQSDGSLVVPFSTSGRTMDLSGTILKLPMSVNWRVSTGFNDTKDILNNTLDYHYRSGSLNLAKNIAGFNVRLGDDYLKSKTDYNAIDTEQTQNYIHANLDRNFGQRLVTFVEAVWNKYDFGQSAASSEHADVYSASAGAHLIVTKKLSADFSASASRNAINVLQLLSQSTTVALPNPLPGISVLDTRSISANANATYHPWKYWTFSGGSGYTNYQLPDSLIASTPIAEQPKLTDGSISYNGAASFARPIWKIEYMGGVSTQVMQQSYIFSTNSDPSIGYNVTNGISGGDDEYLRYSVRYSINHSSNPIFFDLINSNDRFLDFDFSTRYFHFARLNAKVEYRTQSILYAGSSQDQSGINFMIVASRPTFDVSVGRLTTNAAATIFNLLPGGATGVTPPPGTLLTPYNMATSSSDTASITWRVRPNIEFDSRYNKLVYTLIGQGGNLNSNTQWDNYVIYKFGRFDVIGGYAYFDGYTGTYQRRMNLFYFRIKFPFVLW
jgi:hypothetical protein